MAKLTKDELEELLATPEMGVLCTVDAKGRPEGSPIWFEYSDGHIFIHVGGKSKKARNVRERPDVSMTVDTRVPPYKGAVLHGRATIRERDDAMGRRVAVHYLGEEMGDAYLTATAADRESGVLIDVEISGRYTWDYSKDF